MFKTNRYADIREGFLNSLKPFYSDREAQVLFHRLLEHYTGQPHHQLHAFPQNTFAESILRDLANASRDLKECKPWQYILGELDFCGLKLLVNPTVLIPRPETEELVTLCRKLISGRKTSAEIESVSILDACTGSGCIALALQHYFPNAAVSGFDVSQKAVDLAAQNAAINKLPVRFFQADLLGAVPDDLSKFDLIISNPPYITPKEEEAMERNVLRHEPRSALFVPADDPLIFYHALLRWSNILLKYEGLLCVEINEAMVSPLYEAFSAHFLHIELAHDFRDKPRFILAHN